ncbi:MAG: hypothetical protein EZS28_046533, partial [Streblomastix strix]
MQILKGITRASLQDTDFNATNMSNTLVLDMIQRATWFPQLLQNTDILAADRQLMPPLQTIDALASGFYLQAQEFWELGILTIQHILVGKLTESLIDTVSGLVISLRQAERANMARIRLFSGINAHLFDRNNSVMSQTNLSTTQRQIGIQQLTSGQSFANVQDNLIGANAFLNLQPSQRRAMLTSAQITNNLQLEINMKKKQSTQQSQISWALTGLFNIATQPQLNQHNSISPDPSLIRQQQIVPTLPKIQNIQQQGFDSERNQTQRQNTIARSSLTVMKIDMESEKNDINPPPLEAKINQASFIKQEATEPRNHTFLSLSVNRVLVNTILDLDMDRMMNR